MGVPESGPRRPETGVQSSACQSVDERLPTRKRARPLGRHAAVEAMPSDAHDLNRRTRNCHMTAAPAKLAPLLTVAEVAEHLKVDPRTVRRALKKGELHAHYIGRQIRVPQGEVAAFLGRRWR